MRKLKVSRYTLFALNNLSLAKNGFINILLNLRLRLDVAWGFILADILDRALLGYYILLVKSPSEKLLDSLTGVPTNVSLTSDTHRIVTLDLI